METSIVADAVHGDGFVVFRRGRDPVTSSTNVWTHKATSWTGRSFIVATDLIDADAVDVDEDGDIDIVAVRNGADLVSWWANLTCSPGDADDDGDGVRNGCDVCAGSDDTQDSDGDLTPDGCDQCPGEDDRVDLDGNGQPDACEDGAASIAIDNVHPRLSSLRTIRRSRGLLCRANRHTVLAISYVYVNGK